MGTTRGTAVRRRKLNTRQNLPILREDDIERAPVDDETQRHVPKVETGVEKLEESEHHLQAAITAAQSAVAGGKISQIYIPTPESILSNIEYDRLYPKVFAQPSSNIRFSSTVEDCIGVPYCMNSDDEAFLKSYNERNPRPTAQQCTEDQFEDCMNFFEETLAAKQPYAAVDNTPVIGYAEMEESFDDTVGEEARKHAEDIYEHWKSQRLKRGSKGLMARLKFETGQETDDSDPYVCFRRREVRQARKTRGRDAQVTEKLRKLRKELEDARQLIALVCQRERGKRDQLTLDRQIFEQRNAVKEVKRNLGIRGDDEDLVNQKPPKRKALDTGSTTRPSSQLRINPPGRDATADLVQLSDAIVEKENVIEKSIEEQIAKHRELNRGYVDLTWRPITPPLDEERGFAFRPATTEHLPTPPASISSGGEEDKDISMTDAPTPESPQKSIDEANRVIVKYATRTELGLPDRSRPSYRRRLGRGGRTIIDRRGVQFQPTEGVDERLLDRYKYDQDEMNEEVPVFEIDHFDTLRIKRRAAYLSDPRIFSQQQQQQARKRLILNGGGSDPGIANGAGGELKGARPRFCSSSRVTNRLCVSLFSSYLSF